MAVVVRLYPTECPDLTAITPEEWAYIAGFIDGEGCFRVTEKRDHLSGRCHYGLELQVAQVDGRVLQWLQESLGGHLYYSDNLADQRRSPQWRWRINRYAHARVIFLGVLPYLKVKREEVEALVRYRPNLALKRHVELLKKDRAQRSRELASAVNL